MPPSKITRTQINTWFQILLREEHSRRSCSLPCRRRRSARLRPTPFRRRSGGLRGPLPELRPLLPTARALRGGSLRGGAPRVARGGSRRAALRGGTSSPVALPDAAHLPLVVGEVVFPLAASHDGPRAVEVGALPLLVEPAPRRHNFAPVLLDEEADATPAHGAAAAAREEGRPAAHARLRRGAAPPGASSLEHCPPQRLRERVPPAGRALGPRRGGERIVASEGVRREAHRRRGADVAPRVVRAQVVGVVLSGHLVAVRVLRVQRDEEGRVARVEHVGEGGGKGSPVLQRLSVLLRGEGERKLAHLERRRGVGGGLVDCAGGVGGAAVHGVRVDDHHGRGVAPVLEHVRRKAAVGVVVVGVALQHGKDVRRDVQQHCGVRLEQVDDGPVFALDGDDASAAFGAVAERHLHHLRIGRQRRRLEVAQLAGSHALEEDSVEHKPTPGAARQRREGDDVKGPVQDAVQRSRRDAVLHLGGTADEGEQHGAIEARPVHRATLTHHQPKAVGIDGGAGDRHLVPDPVPALGVVCCWRRVLLPSICLPAPWEDKVELPARAVLKHTDHRHRCMERASWMKLEMAI
mmetsp:Transcript_37774/g.126399  ORF Transcript_37774/g.126399 Transcript_37774/m.126399 type:complete len:579 (-) Transcript_37774:82-1818(-)